MYTFLGALVICLLGTLLPVFIPRLAPWRWQSVAAGAVFAFFVVFSTSFYVVSPGQIGHLNRVYFGASPPAGQIIAFSGENGPQAEVLGPGLHFRPFLRLVYKTEEFPIISVPNGQYGLLTAKDGQFLGAAQFLAAGWSEDKVTDMLKAEYFLGHGGQKGVQLTILRPGQYLLNRYLFDVSLSQALDVEAGYVAVIKSNIQETADCPKPMASQKEANGADRLSIPLVPRGCIGVWQEPLPPGRYYLNHMAYQPTLIPTRAQPLVYRGGYVQRDIEVSVDRDGTISEQERQTTITTPAEAADVAIFVTVEGWRIPLEVRLVIQVDARQAPQLVAAVGDLQALEEVLVTPILRSVVRDVIEVPERRVLDLIEKRRALEDEIEKIMQRYGHSVGISIRSVRFGDPAIPPELLVVQQRQHIAQQLQDTYLKEQLAQQTRIEVKKAQAMADQQPDLVRAELSVKIAELAKLVAQKQGEGEMLRLVEIAKGQKQQAQVLGKDQALQLAILKEIIAAAKENPEIVKVPTVLVQGESNGMAGPAAILGAGNLLQWIHGNGHQHAPTQP